MQNKIVGLARQAQNYYLAQHDHLSSIRQCSLGPNCAFPQRLHLCRQAASAVMHWFCFHSRPDNRTKRQPLWLPRLLVSQKFSVTTSWRNGAPSRQTSLFPTDNAFDCSPFSWTTLLADSTVCGFISPDDLAILAIDHYTVVDTLFGCWLIDSQVLDLLQQPSNLSMAAWLWWLNYMTTETQCQVARKTTLWLSCVRSSLADTWTCPGDPQPVTMPEVAWVCMTPILSHLVQCPDQPHTGHRPRGLILTTLWSALFFEYMSDIDPQYLISYWFAFPVF